MSSPSAVSDASVTTTGHRLVRTPPQPVIPPVLDAAQQRVVDHGAGPLLVLAGPGTGKTTTLVEAVARRVEAGTPPERVLVLTFSRKAAVELRDRMAGRAGAARAPQATTFHSYCYALVRAHQDSALFSEPLRLLSGPEQDLFVRELLAGEAGLAARGRAEVRWPDELRACLTTRGFADEVRAVLARSRELGLGPQTLADFAEKTGRPDWGAAASFLAEYLDVLDAQGVLDYAELVHRAVLLADTGLVADQLRSQYDAVFVDEYQDTDAAQVRLLHALAGQGRTLLAFGDPDQSIYAFRGADVGGILGFRHAFPAASGTPAPVAVLRTSRRSGRVLLDATRELARRMPLPRLPADAARAHRALRSTRAGGRVEAYTYPTPSAELDNIADILRRAHLEDGVPWNEMAVLVRAGDRTIPPLRRALTSAGVPLDVTGDDLALRHEPAVQPLLLALRAAATGAASPLRAGPTSPAEVDVAPPPETAGPAEADADVASPVEAKEAAKATPAPPAGAARTSALEAAEADAVSSPGTARSAAAQTSADAEWPSPPGTAGSADTAPTSPLRAGDSVGVDAALPLEAAGEASSSPLRADADAALPLGADGSADADLPPGAAGPGEAAPDLPLRAAGPPVGRHGRAQRPEPPHPAASESRPAAGAGDGGASVPEAAVSEVAASEAAAPEAAAPGVAAGEGSETAVREDAEGGAREDYGSASEGPAQEGSEAGVQEGSEADAREGSNDAAAEAEGSEHAAREGSEHAAREGSAREGSEDAAREGRPPWIGVDTALALLTSPLGGLDAADLRRLGRALREEERAAGRSVPRPSDQLLAEALAEPERLVAHDPAYARGAQRLGALLRKAREALAGGATAEEALWTLWDGTPWPGRLERAARRGSRNADRDLDAVVALFETAARAEERTGGRGALNFLEEVDAQDIAADTLSRRGAARQDAVRLMTAHRAKGLEWRLVVVAQVQEGLWPDLRRRGSLLEADRIAEDAIADPLTPGALLAEERRLFYAAATRAKERLVVTAVRAAADDGDQPSRFLTELGIEPKAVTTRPRRPLSVTALVAELRATTVDPSASKALREAAAERLARLAALTEDGQPLVPAAHPQRWWGLAEPTANTVPVRDPHDPVALSGSALDQLVNTCSLQWFLGREVRAEQPSSTAQGFGLVVHALADEVASGRTPADLGVLMQRLDTVWDGLAFEAPWKSGQEKENARAALARFLRWHVLERGGREPVGSEQDFDVTLKADAYEVRIRGSMDRVEQDADGHAYVVDFKTGKQKPSGAAIEIHPQLAVYQAAVRAGAVDELFGGRTPEPGGAELVHLRLPAPKREGGDAQPAVQQQPPPPDAWVGELLATAAARVLDERFRPTPGDHCATCSFRSSCSARPEGRHIVE